MLWKSWNDAVVIVVLFLVVSLLVGLRYLLIPHVTLTWVAVVPRAYASRRLALFAFRSARAALTKVSVTMW
jgi:hypothetical protein